MKVAVTMMRQHGKRAHGYGREPVRGMLKLHWEMAGGESHKVAELVTQDVRGSNAAQLLPPLYAAELVALGDGSMLLRGFESVNGAAYVQEWHCALVG
jgi:hypothetical protein